MSGRGIRIAVIAGEASGDAIGAGIVRALGASGAEVWGAGGERMRAACVAAAGRDSEAGRAPFALSDVAVMGFAEVLPSLWRVRRAIASAAAWVAHEVVPDILVSIDAKGFTSRVAAEAAALDRRSGGGAGGRPWTHVQVVAPSLWAWRSERKRRAGAEALAAAADGVVSVVPMDAGVLGTYVPELPVAYVGYPAVAEVAVAVAEDRAGREPPCAWTGSNDVPLRLGLLPGSRRQEVDVLLPLLADAVREVAERVGRVSATIVGATPALSARMVAHLPLEAEPGVAWTVVDASRWGADDRAAALRSFHVVGAASGTAVCEAAAAGVPVVAAYPGTAVHAALASYALALGHVSLPNILAAGPLRGGPAAPIPEHIFGADLTPSSLAASLHTLATSPSARATQRAAIAPALAALTPSPPTLPGPPAAAAILAFHARRLARHG